MEGLRYAETWKIGCMSKSEESQLNYSKVGLGIDNVWMARD